MMKPDSNAKSHLFVGALLGSIAAYAVLVSLLVGVCHPTADPARPGLGRIAAAVR